MKQVNFKDFKIVPLVDTIRRLDMSDEVYFTKYKQWISNSRLKLINPKDEGSPKKYREVEFNGKTQSLTIGSRIHECLLQPEEFKMPPRSGRPSYKLGGVADSVKTYRKQGLSIRESIQKAAWDNLYYVNSIDNKIANFKKYFKDAFSYYWRTKDWDPNLKLMSDKDWDTCNECINSVTRNQDIHKLLHPTDDFMEPLPSFNEDAMFMDCVVMYQGKYTILHLKCKIDNWTIDEENKILTLNDLKTTSHNVQWFMYPKWGSFVKYFYYTQFAFYRMFLEAYCSKVYGYNTHDWTFKSNVLVVSTVTHESRVHPVSKGYFILGKEEYEQLLKRVAYYEIFGYEEEVNFV